VNAAEAGVGKKQEFAVAGAYRYNHASPTTSLASHIPRPLYLPLVTVLTSIVGNSLMSHSRVLVGDAFCWIETASRAIRHLGLITLTVARVRVGQATVQLIRYLAVELGQIRPKTRQLENSPASRISLGQRPINSRVEQYLTR